MKPRENFNDRFSEVSPRALGIGRRRRQGGQTLLEIALLLPLLILLFLGVIEFGRYGYISILVGNAARAGTAYGVQSLPQSVDTTGILNAARNDFKNNGQVATNLAVTSSVSCGCDSSGSVVTAACIGTQAGICAAGSHWVVTLSVQASGTFGALFNYPLIPATITLSKTSSMRVRPA